MKYYIATAALFVTSAIFISMASFAASTQKIEVVDVKSKFYQLNEITAKQATFGYFHLSIPVDGSISVAVHGNDNFVKSSGSNNSPRINISLENKVAFAKFGNVGQHSVAFTTHCGTTVSVVVDVYERKAFKAGTDANNKVAFLAEPDCKLPAPK